MDETSENYAAGIHNAGCESEYAKTMPDHRCGGDLIG
jgi:hypothetical protein